jgi:hypothetical protein
MDLSQMNVCAICGGKRLGTERWFLVAENRWEDKLKVLQWNERLAAHEGNQRACSAAAVEELVVHWMTTGSLGYPFARAGFGVGTARLIGGTRDATGEVDTRGVHLIGELAVHRESMERVLFESPQSLRTILDALLEALRARPLARRGSRNPRTNYPMGFTRESKNGPSAQT